MSLFEQLFVLITVVTPLCVAIFAIYVLKGDRDVGGKTETTVRGAATRK